MRCFGVDKKITDCDWDFISELQTLKEPRGSMPRLLDLIEFLAQPQNESIWLQLDIKVCLSNMRFGLALTNRSLIKMQTK